MPSRKRWAHALPTGRLADRKVENIVDIQRTGRGIGGWFGLAPDDSPLVARDIRTQEIYALAMDWP